MLHPDSDPVSSSAVTVVVAVVVWSWPLRATGAKLIELGGVTPSVPPEHVYSSMVPPVPTAKP